MSKGMGKELEKSGGGRIKIPNRNRRGGGRAMSRKGERRPMRAWWRGLTILLYSVSLLSTSMGLGVAPTPYPVHRSPGEGNLTWPTLNPPGLPEAHHSPTKRTPYE